MARPLQIYLDSSDFSNFADPHGNDIYPVIERKLVEWSDAGLIEVRFSYLHIVEASPVRPDYIPASKRRMAKIKRLCGQKCIRSTISIIEREISSPGAWRTPDYLDWIFPDDGNWFPNIDDLDIELSINEILRREIKESGVCRASRRKLEREWFDLRGDLKAAAKEEFRRNQPRVIEQFQQKFPLTAEAANEIGELMLTEADKAVIQGKLLKAIGQDVSLWPAWYENHWDRVAPITDFLRSSGRNINAGLSAVTEKMKELQADWEAKGYPVENLIRIAEQSFEEISATMQADIVRRLSSELAIDRGICEGKDPWQTRPGLTMALSVQRQIARRIIGLRGNPRKPGDGDFGDVLHCVHLPFVDFFRADGFSASVIAEVKPPFSTKVVPKLAQLPDLIWSRLADTGYDEKIR